MRSILLLAAVIAGLLVYEAKGSADPPRGTVFVAADADPGLDDSGWVDSGVDVTAGETLTIDAHGQAITGPLRVFPGARSGPDGQVTSCPDAGGPAVDCAANDAPYGALIGRVDGVSFVVGSHFEDVAPGSGRLYLAVNDNLTYYFDNEGGFAVQLR